MEIIVKNGTSTNLGLMAFWATFEKKTLLKYIKWHNCEHMAERVSIPDFKMVEGMLLTESQEDFYSSMRQKRRRFLAQNLT